MSVQAWPDPFLCRALLVSDDKYLKVSIGESFTKPTIGGQQWNLSSCLLDCLIYVIPDMAESDLSSNQHYIHYIKYVNGLLSVSHDMWVYHSSANHENIYREHCIIHTAWSLFVDLLALVAMT